MFDTIAPTYDVLNHVLSFGLDIRWRKKAVGKLAEKRGGTFLDIAAGSGDVSIELRSLNPQSVVASDFAVNMLNVLRKKLGNIAERPPIHLATADALSLPFRESSFDGTIVAFGIRNFADRARGLSEMLRVLKPGGISVILELTTPTTPVVSTVYNLYGRWGLPLIGRMISSDDSAYKYLPASVAAFPKHEEFLNMMKGVGFIATEFTALTLGVATIYTGRKPATPRE